MAKAAFCTDTDAEARRRGERTGLDTPAVHAVNVVHSVSRILKSEVPKLTH